MVDAMNGYDALLLLSFGGPEGPDDVLPFLRNVVSGRDVPDERLQLVAERYQQFGGVSPINACNRELLERLREEIPELPIYWGNRNWHPFLADTLAEMKADGIGRAIAFATSAYSSYSSCRQYLEDIDTARAKVGRGAPTIDKIPPYSDHPGFVEATRTCVQRALDELEDINGRGGNQPTLLFTAHSLPEAMADACDYARELRTVSESVAPADVDWRLVYQSRSGPPSVPWLAPDILDALRELAAAGVGHVVVAPIGFVSDHMEVVYDLDVEAKDLAAELDLTLVRARTVGTEPRFVSMVRDLVVNPYRDACEPGCCPAPRRKRP